MSKKKPIFEKEEDKIKEDVGIPKRLKVLIISLVSVLVVGTGAGYWYYSTHNSLDRADKGISEKNKEEGKKKDKIIEQEKENSSTSIAYYEEVQSFIEEKNGKNGLLSVEEEEILVDKEFGDGIYKKYLSGYLPSKRLTPSDMEQVILRGRAFEKGINTGYMYKNIKLSEDGNIKNDEIPYEVIDSYGTYLPTTDGFNEMGDGSHVGYPYLTDLESTEGHTLLLNALVYFDKDMTLKELSEYKLNLKLSNNSSLDLNTLPLEDGFKEMYTDNGMEHPYDLLGNFGNSPLDSNTDFSDFIYSKGYDTSIKLAKGGILTYSVKVDINQEDIDKLNKELEVYIGDVKTTVTGLKGEQNNISFKVVR